MYSESATCKQGKYYFFNLNKLDFLDSQKTGFAADIMLRKYERQAKIKH